MNTSKNTQKIIKTKIEKAEKSGFTNETKAEILKLSKELIAKVG